MNPGIRVSKSGKSIDNKEGLIFDTDNPSAMISKEFQVFFPVDPNFDYINIKEMKKTIPHNMGFTPVIYSYASSDYGKTWTEWSWNIGWDDKCVYIYEIGASDMNYLIQVLAINLEKEFEGSGSQQFSSFRGNKNKFGIISKKNKIEKFNTNIKKVPISKIVISDTPPFSATHKYDRPVMFDAFGKIMVDETTSDSWFIGKWKNSYQGLGSQPTSTYDTVSVSDPGGYFSEVSFVIYGAI